MKTVFKKGMKVYDQLIFPDKEGIVLTTNYIPEKFFDEDDFDENYVHPYPIEVEFGSETMFYTSDGDSGMCGLKTLSTKPYKVELQGFEQKAPVRTYEEAVEWLEKNSKDRVIYADEAYINEEYERAFEVLKKLTILRDYYNEGWQPDWKDNNWKHFILFDEGNLATGSNKSSCRVLFFKSEKVRNKFLEEQRELLEIAKPLL
ncbi:hypothetical protein [uncultured Capnocytophaga sp.]|uniref:hypothetical protein n=1 Tax=uncultured Capnocytophaga sp. TaxID=159273 RepID=UPI00260D39AB|nr:hypothetical protein [uncultured Capnocytophaga sp.]